MRRSRFLQVTSAIVTVPLPLHVFESGTTYTLQNTFFHPSRGGPFPLIVLNHGAPGNYDTVATQFTRFTMQSDWFVRQGFAVIVPNRRGYGGSTGPFAEATGPCDHPNFRRAADASAQDILAATDAMRDNPLIDPSRIVLAGASAGGFGSLAAAAKAPGGVVGIINVDGGRGSLGPGKNCDPQQLIEIAGEFGATTGAPSLWMYAANDHRFNTTLARAMFDAYGRGRPAGRDTFLILPASGDEGHYLFETAAAVDSWTVPASAFLSRVVGGM
jgi:dienelactone hydrolase